MTYKEALQNSLEKFTTDQIDFVDMKGNHIHEDSKEVLPVTFAEFMTNMAAVLVMVSEGLFAVNVGDIYMGDKKVTDGKPKALPTLHDCMKVLTGIDVGRGTILGLQVNQFVEWLLEQEAEDADFEKMWFNYETLAHKWNEHAKTKMGG